jgi:hypothetical protein
VRPRPSGIGLCVLITMIGWPVAGGEVVTGRVTPRTGYAPADVVVQAFIEPNVLNRSVSFVVDSRAFYRSSSVELEGDRAPRTKEVKFRMLPPGWYEVTVTVYDGNKEPRGQAVEHIELW